MARHFPVESVTSLVSRSGSAPWKAEASIGRIENIYGSGSYTTEAQRGKAASFQRSAGPPREARTVEIGNSLAKYVTTEPQRGFAASFQLSAFSFWSWPSALDLTASRGRPVQNLARHKETKN
jgi:hypothetical protein